VYFSVTISSGKNTTSSSSQFISLKKREGSEWVLKIIVFSHGLPL
jgi:hypothetical protein